MSINLAAVTFAGELGNGLVRRWSTPADQERIGRLIGEVFRNEQYEAFNERSADVVRIVLSETLPNPFMGPGDFALVEDRSKPERPVVCCTCFWRHEWSYSGITFGVGQPEMVATHRDYRNRGLVRALFEMIHARSAAEGHLVQAITGIPYFYRQFGYEYVLDLGGHRSVKLAAIPAKTDDNPERYRLRPATRADVEHLTALYNQSRAGSLVWHEVDDHYWRYVVDSWDDPVVLERGPVRTGFNARMFMVVDTEERVCGCTWLAGKRWDQNFRLHQLDLYPHVNWRTAMPCLLRAVAAQAERAPAIKPDAGPASEISLQLGRSHPAYEVLGETLASNYDPPYAWYLRVADLPAFIQRIAPVLETRLDQSILPGHSGELKFDFYRSGLRLHFDCGRLECVEPWQAPVDSEEAQAGCPPLIFLQLLFGYRSLAELRATLPDVWADEHASVLINILFPKQPSAVYSLDNT